MPMAGLRSADFADERRFDQPDEGFYNLLRSLKEGVSEIVTSN
jgi:hypothetical protein